jgi:iron complex outermembrane recepter protein
MKKSKSGNNKMRSCTSSNRFKLLDISLKLLAVSAVACIATSTWAANAANSASSSAQADDVALEEVVVTARKLSENVQDVPESITVFSAEEISAARIQSIVDFADLTPNLDIRRAEAPGEFYMTIRGISQANRGDAPVTMVVDGATLPFANSFGRPLFDVSQIEVLKGPQGSLYGQNAIGGAIIVTTKQPTNDLSGYLDVSDGNYNDATVTGSLSGAIVPDRLLFRVAGNYHNDDGDASYAYIPNQKVNYDHSGNARVELKAIFSDRFTATLSAGTGSERWGGQPLVPVTKSIGSAIPNVTTAQLNQSLVLGQDNDVPATSTKQTSTDVSAKLEYDAGFATITSVTSAQNLSEPEFRDLAVEEFPFLTIDDGNFLNAVSEEFRLASPTTQQLRWVAGLFYLSDHRFFNQVVNGNLNLIANGNTNPADATYVPINIANQNQHLDARAVFGQASYDIVKNLELTLGGRYDSDPRTNTNIGSAPTTTEQKTFTEFQPKASLKYQFAPQANVYFTYADGFRPGGFNLCANSDVQQAFAAETTQAYEVGLKSTLFDRRLTLDLAGFYTDYHNEQLTLLQDVGGVASLSTYNVNRTQIDGVEVSFDAVPMAGLDVSGAFGSTDSVIKQFGNTLSGAGFNPATYIGKQTPLVSNYKADLSVQYTHALSAHLDGVARADVEYTGKFYWEPDNSVAQNPYTLVNLKIGVRGDKWEARLYGDNIFDAKYYVVYYQNNFTQAPGNFNFANPSLKPRYGVELSYRF